MRDELAAGIINQGRFAARLNAVEHLAQHRSLASTRRSQQCEVTAFEIRWQGHRCYLEAPRIGLTACHFPQRLFVNDHRTANHSILPRRPSALAHHPCKPATPCGSDQQTNNSAEHRIMHKLIDQPLVARVIGDLAIFDGVSLAAHEDGHRWFGAGSFSNPSAHPGLFKMVGGFD
jgi:hypothetical protein